ncbi:MAG: asparagine synthetase B, partial [Nitrospinota bacterium]
MCGIAGIVSESKVSVEALDKAAQIQKHRGPDASGVKVFSAGVWNVGLAHQRLKIIDLSDAANQPMELDSGKSAIIYNGEVYNYIELRSELEKEGYRFKTSSDTEVVLKALDCWGVEGALNRFNGMWAFAWFDVQNKRIVLARDRVGVKPLNYALLDGKLYFASEVKTIIEMSGKKFALNRQ